MHRSFRLLGLPRALPLALLVTVVLSLSLVACSEKSPEEKIEAIRHDFSAELTNFVVMQTPVADEAATEESLDGQGEEPADQKAADQDGADQDGSEELPMDGAPVEVTKSILLDILVQNTSSETLPGITVDISQIDPSGREKGSWKVFLELPHLAHGMTEQVGYVLEDADFVEGDGFHAEVRSPIPAAERGDYAEF